LRRVLRRGVRYGRTLGFHEPFFFKLVDVLAQTMGDVFPEIRTKQKQIKETIKREEESFNKTLDKGIELFEQAVASFENDPNKSDKRVVSGAVLRGSDALIGWSKDSAGRVHSDITGDFAFKLYDTYGFPLDLTELMAREREMTVDVDNFNRLMNEQRTRARAAQKKSTITVQHIVDFPTKFVGYKILERTRLLKLSKGRRELAVTSGRLSMYRRFMLAGRLETPAIGVCRRWQVTTG
jgi:alanyl-tRNA synthetase